MLPRPLFPKKVAEKTGADVTRLENILLSVREPVSI